MSVDKRIANEIERLILGGGQLHRVSDDAQWASLYMEVPKMLYALVILIAAVCFVAGMPYAFWLLSHLK